jgi:hypothetical protein
VSVLATLDNNLITAVGHFSEGRRCFKSRFKIDWSPLVLFRKRRETEIGSIEPNRAGRGRRSRPYHGGALPTELRGQRPYCSRFAGRLRLAPAVRRVDVAS